MCKFKGKFFVQVHLNCLCFIFLSKLDKDLCVKPLKIMKLFVPLVVVQSEEAIPHDENGKVPLWHLSAHQVS